MDEESRRKIWLIRLQDNEGNCSVGSGVLVRLKEREDLSGGGSVAAAPKNYLLTCAHLVKTFSPDGNGFIGTGATRKKAVCWPHGRGFVEWADLKTCPPVETEGVWVANLVDPYNRPEGTWDREDCSDEKDWVLLEVEEKDFQKKEAIFLSSEIVEPLSIVGFPNGLDELKGGAHTRNRVSPGFKVDRHDSNPQILRPEGSWPTGKGMSGGGVFNARQELVALYRGQNNSNLSAYAVKIDAIRSELYEPTVGQRELPKSDLISPPSKITSDGHSTITEDEEPQPEPRFWNWKLTATLFFCLFLIALTAGYFTFISNVLRPSIDYTIELLPSDFPSPTAFADVPTRAENEDLQYVADTKEYRFTYVNKTNQDFWLMAINCDILYLYDNASSSGEEVTRRSPWGLYEFPALTGTANKLDQTNFNNHLESGRGLYFMVLRGSEGDFYPIGPVNLFRQKNTTLVVEKIDGELKHNFVNQ